MDCARIIIPAAWMGSNGHETDCFTLTLALATKIEHAFAEEGLLSDFSKKELRDRVQLIGCNAGIALSNNMPASLGFDFAHTLARSASGILGDCHRSAIDFAFISPGKPFCRQVNVFREPGRSHRDVWFPFGRNIQLRLTQKPYTLQKYKDLLDLCDNIRHKARELMPETLFALKRAFEEDPQTAFLYALYQLSRLSKEERELLGISLFPGGKTALSWWMFNRMEEQGIADLSQHKWSTALSDILEVLGTLATSSRQQRSEPAHKREE